MPSNKPTRKQLFRAALAWRGMTGDEWARQQGITNSHLSAVIGGKRESASLNEKVDEFIRDTLPAEMHGAATAAA